MSNGKIDPRDMFQAGQVKCPLCSGPVRFVQTRSSWDGAPGGSYSLEFDVVCPPCGHEFQVAMESMPGLIGIRLEVVADDVRDNIVEGVTGKTIRKVSPYG